MTWFHTESPFGGVAFAVAADGAMTVRPAFAVEPATEHQRSAGIESVPVDERRADDGGTEYAALTINRVAYSRGFYSVELRQNGAAAGEPWVRFSYSGLSESAQRKLEAWLLAEYANMATPARVADARTRQARRAVETAEAEAARAESAAKAARLEFERATRIADEIAAADGTDPAIASEAVTVSALADLLAEAARESVRERPGLSDPWSGDPLGGLIFEPVTPRMVAAATLATGYTLDLDGRAARKLGGARYVRDRLRRWAAWHGKAFSEVTWALADDVRRAAIASVALSPVNGVREGDPLPAIIYAPVTSAMVDAVTITLGRPVDLDGVPRGDEAKAAHLRATLRRWAARVAR